MDPLRAFIASLQENFAGTLPQELLGPIEQATKQLLAQFELVPKHEYEAHMAILASLNAQVASLEQRLEALEQAG